MIKKQTLKNVIPRLDRGIQDVFNFNAKDPKSLLVFGRTLRKLPLKKEGKQKYG